MIKYLGSKRTMVGALGDVAEAAGARTAVDLFTGTTRVAQEFKRRGLDVTATDVASYSGVLADCYIATDAGTVDPGELDEVLARLNALPGRAGYFTDTFCKQARFFNPINGVRVDAIRDEIEATYRTSPLYPILLTSLMEAADRVDSTTGVQMAYLKKWAPRALKSLNLRAPALIPGTGSTVVGDAMTTVDRLAPADLMYLDPPYNHHSYRGNYHVWETLVRWDAPATYGVARKRVDIQDADTKSVFNRKRDMPEALASLFARARAKTLVVSYNNESWIDAEQMDRMLRDAGREEVGTLAFEKNRYVGARIGIHNNTGQKVGQVGATKNLEYVFIAGEPDVVQECVRAGRPHGAVA
ncbi:DNA adenine methylase (plasmid) [Citricoccus nitrophenolicus]